MAWTLHLEGGPLDGLTREVEHLAMHDHYLFLTEEGTPLALVYNRKYGTMDDLRAQYSHLESFGEVVEPDLDERESALVRTAMLKGRAFR